MDNLRMKIDLITTKVEILKLKANHYDWSCHVTNEIKEQLNQTLVDIDQELIKLNVE